MSAVRTVPLFALGLATALLAACSSDAPEAPATESTPAATASERPGPGEAVWKEVAAVKLAGPLVLVAETEDRCCGDLPADQGSPVRIYLTSTDEAARDGFLLYLDAQDKPVLAGQSGPEQYGRVLWTGEAAIREATTVTVSVPVEGLPGGVLRVWAGGTVPLTLGGQELPIKLASGEIPYASVDTGRVAAVRDPAGAAGEAAPGSGRPGVAPPTGAPGSGRPDLDTRGGAPPAGVEPNTGDPDLDRKDGEPPPGVEPKSGDPGKPPLDGAVPDGQKPQTGDVGKDVPKGVLPAGKEPKSGDPELDGMTPVKPVEGPSAEDGLPDPGGDEPAADEAPAAEAAPAADPAPAAD